MGPDKYIGLDLGGTKLCAVIISKDGNLLSDLSCSTNMDQGLEYVKLKIVESIQSLMNQAQVSTSEVAGIGVGFAGQVDSEAGLVVGAPNLHGWHNIPLSEYLLDQFPIPKVILTNDVRAATWAEYCLRGKEIKDMVCVLIGTGIGGGLIVGGQLVHGKSNTAGEVGHLIYKPGGRRCRCGKKGCFEAYGGGYAISQRAKRSLARGSSLREALKKINHPEDKDVYATVVEKAALHGDKTAKNIWDEAKTCISVLCAGLVTLLNPEVLILGGGLLAHSKTLLPTVRDAVQELSMRPSARSVRVEKWSFGAKTCAIGAAFMAID